MLRNTRFPHWPKAIVEEVGLAVSHWTQSKSGLRDSLWPASPHWLSRYLGELMYAHTHSVATQEVRSVSAYRPR
jgi:hypothetical protein